MLSVRRRWRCLGLVLISAAALAALSLGSRPPLADGTGGGLQMPVKPDYQITRPSALGLCQCTRETKAFRASCQPSRVVCESLCASPVYAYVPNASFSCPAPSEGMPSLTS